MLATIDETPVGDVDEFAQVLRDRFATALGVPPTLLSSGQSTTPTYIVDYASAMDNAFSDAVCRMHKRVIRYCKLAWKRRLLMANYRLYKRTTHRRILPTQLKRQPTTRKPNYAPRTNPTIIRQRINHARTAMSVRSVSRVGYYLG